MVSHLDSLFRAGFRPLEKTDTWQGIRREEETDPHKRKQRERQEKDDTPVTDDTVLSVAALHSFLVMLVEQATPAETRAPPPVVDSRPAPQSLSQATCTTYAASAYQSGARTAPGELLSRSDMPPPASPVAPALALSVDDLRQIHTLIADVQHLAERGVTTITLRPAGSFLESLRNGVDEAL